MATSTGGYSASGYGAGGGGAGGGGKRPYDPHGKDHPKAGPCLQCGFDMGPRAHRQHIIHRMEVPCPLGCRGVVFVCRAALRYHVWYVHRANSEGCVRDPADPEIACRCGCAWYTSHDQYMQNHDSYCRDQ